MRLVGTDDYGYDDNQWPEQKSGTRIVSERSGDAGFKGMIGQEQQDTYEHQEDGQRFSHLITGNCRIRDREPEQESCEKSDGRLELVSYLVKNQSAEALQENLEKYGA